MKCQHPADLKYGVTASRVRLPGQLLVVMQVLPQPLVGPTGQPTPLGILPSPCRCRPYRCRWLGLGWAGSRAKWSKAHRCCHHGGCRVVWQMRPGRPQVVGTQAAAARDFDPVTQPPPVSYPVHCQATTLCVAYTVGFQLHPSYPLCWWCEWGPWLFPWGLLGLPPLTRSHHRLRNNG